MLRKVTEGYGRLQRGESQVVSIATLRNIPKPYVTLSNVHVFESGKNRRLRNVT